MGLEVVMFLHSLVAWELRGSMEETLHPSGAKMERGDMFQRECMKRSQCEGTIS